MYYTDNVPFFRFYKPFVIAAPILFVLMFIICIYADALFIASEELDPETAAFWMAFFGSSPLVVPALDLIIGIFVARKNRENHIRMIEQVHEAHKNEKRIFGDI